MPELISSRALIRFPGHVASSPSTCERCTSRLEPTPSRACALHRCSRHTHLCAKPYAALQLLGHLCSGARPRPYTHTQALRLLHVRPCHMTNALSRRLRPVTTLGLFTSHLSRSRRVLPFPLKNCQSPYSLLFVTAISTSFSGQRRLVFVSTRGLCTVHATPLHPLGFCTVWPRAFSPHPHATRRCRTSPPACVTAARVQAAQLPCARPSPWSRLLPSRRLASSSRACATRHLPSSLACSVPLVLQQ
jgi:hypothetical protein